MTHEPRRAARRAWLGAVIGLPALRVRAQPSDLEGYYLWEGRFADGSGIRLAGGRFCFVDRAGYPTSVESPFVVHSDRIEVSPSQPASTRLQFRRLPDGRLEIRLPQVGLTTLRPRFVTAPARPQEPGPALAREPVPAVGGTWGDVQGRPALRFVSRLVYFLGSGPEGRDLGLPYEQKGPLVTVHGPHMSETLRLLQDGRLMLSREHMTPVYYRRLD